MNIDFQKWLSIALILSVAAAPLQAVGAYGHDHDTTETVSHQHEEINSHYSAASEYADMHCGNDSEQDQLTDENGIHNNKRHNCKEGACECDNCGHCSMVHINIALTTFMTQRYQPQRLSNRSILNPLNQDILLPIEIRPPIFFSL